MALRTLPQRVAAYMRDLDAKSESVRVALWGLQPEQLAPYGFDAYLLNLISLFGERWLPERARAVAAECARRRLWEGWSCHAYIRALKRRLAECADERGAQLIIRSAVHIRGWDESGFDYLARRGAIVCSFHMAAFRHIFIDLMLRGYSVAQPFDDDAYHDYSASFDGMYPPLRERVRFVNVEREPSKDILAQALSEGRLIVAFLDGNTGSGGPKSMRGRSAIEFGGLRIAVKHGLARLAAARGVPLIPVFALQAFDGGYRVSVDEPITPPPQPLPDEAEREFARSAMQQLYAALERRILSNPEQWESVARLHQWRVAPPEPDSREEKAEQLKPCWPAGVAVRLDERRLVRLGSTGGDYWIDARTLRVYRPRTAGVEDVIAKLHTREGITAAWLASQPRDRDWHDRARKLLDELEARGIIVPVASG